MNTLISRTLKNTRNLAVVVGIAITGHAQAELYYFHNDHLGTPQVVTDTNGDVVWEGRYDPFGEVDETTAAVQQDLRFSGQLLDRETGLHYNYFRDYNPSTGRYATSDPIGLVGGINTYNYVLSNPIALYDPYGQKSLGDRIKEGFCRMVPDLCPSPNKPEDKSMYCFNLTDSKEGCLRCCASRGPVEYALEQGGICGVNCNDAFGVFACSGPDSNFDFV